MWIIISQLICIICKIYRIKVLWKLEFWHKSSFTFSAKYLANIAFSEFFKDECYLPRDHYWLDFGDLEKQNCLTKLWHNYFITLLIWSVSMEVLVDCKIELTYTLLMLYLWQVLPIFRKVFQFWHIFASKMLLIPTWVIAQS